MASIVSLAELDPVLVREFLIQQGTPPEIVDWKYFDLGFNRGRTRGLAYVANGKVSAFIGLIPFQTLHRGHPVEAAWSCDWYRSQEAPGAMGILLMKHTLSAYPLIYSLGGASATRSILPRLAKITIPDAGVVLHKPLRAGALLAAANHITGKRLLRAPRFIENFPVAWPTKTKAELATDLQVPLSPSLTDMIEKRKAVPLRASYDFDHIDWELNRCPSLLSGACTLKVSNKSLASILFWRPKSSVEFWRIAVIGDANVRELEPALNHVVQYIHQKGGWLISTLASRFETDWTSLLQSKGFRAAKTRRPLFILARDSEVDVEEFQRLSFLDTDYAYRFPSTKTPDASD